jgi:hypothetical protein
MLNLNLCELCFSVFINGELSFWNKTFYLSFCREKIQLKSTNEAVEDP